MTWDGVVTKYHRKHSKDIWIIESVESYIQTIVLKKTLESISFEYIDAAPSALTRLRTVQSRD
ncbi:hypothetical protein PAEPH01_2691 [Pancytospora epiphaga]|nr:hypothetical protein PAEPH01_2691 [Pancytospora epiphaga]